MRLIKLSDEHTTITGTFENLERITLLHQIEYEVSCFTYFENNSLTSFCIDWFNDVARLDIGEPKVFRFGVYGKYRIDDSLDTTPDHLLRVLGESYNTFKRLFNEHAAKYPSINQIDKLGPLHIRGMVDHLERILSDKQPS